MEEEWRTLIIKAPAKVFSIAGILPSADVNKLPHAWHVKDIFHGIHEKEARAHAGLRNLIKKLLRNDLSYLTVEKDAKDLLKKHDGCQNNGKPIQEPKEKLGNMFAAYSLNEGNILVEAGHMSWRMGVYNKN